MIRAVAVASVVTTYASLCVLAIVASNSQLSVAFVSLFPG